MTNREILRIALEQSAADSGCRAEDFLSGENRVVLSKKSDKARRYLELPFACDLVSYGHNIVASVSPGLKEVVSDYVNHFRPEHCFETPGLHVLEAALRSHGYGVCFMAEYFLPDVKALRPIETDYELRMLLPPDFKGLYLPQWSNALCKKRAHLDRLAVGAYQGSELIGLAGASADCDTMWQIGVDVLPEYRRRGIASALTARLALLILARGIVPFYCAAWSNIASVRNAFRAGFRPAWVQLTAKELSYIERMNEG